MLNVAIGCYTRVAPAARQVAAKFPVRSLGVGWVGGWGQVVRIGRFQLEAKVEQSSSFDRWFGHHPTF